MCVCSRCSSTSGATKGMSRGGSDAWAMQTLLLGYVYAELGAHTAETGAHLRACRGREHGLPIVDLHRSFPADPRGDQGTFNLDAQTHIVRGERDSNPNFQRQLSLEQRDHGLALRLRLGLALREISLGA